MNIYRQCGVGHVDDRIHILFIMSKKPTEKILHQCFSDPIQIAHQHLLFLRISPFLCKYDYLNEIIVTSSYSSQQHDYANYLHNIFCVNNHCVLCSQNMFQLSYKPYNNNASNIVNCKGKTHSCIYD